jgi:hypothetical protein
MKAQHMPSAMPLDPRDVLAAETADAAALQAAVERRWPSSATLVQTVPVRAELGGNVIDAVVHVFDLAQCAKAARAYAWTAPIEDTHRRRLQVALHIGPIKSPTDAVWATLADEVRARRLAERQPEPVRLRSKQRHWLAPKLQALGL